MSNSFCWTEVFFVAAIQECIFQDSSLTWNWWLPIWITDNISLKACLVDSVHCTTCEYCIIIYVESLVNCTRFEMHRIGHDFTVFSSPWLSFPKVIGITTSNRIWLREKAESLFVTVCERVLECYITHVFFHWVI